MVSRRTTSKSQRIREEALDRASADSEERKAEAHARFAAGLLEDLRDDDAAALENFEKSIEADPSQESLALDVARRHLMRKDTDRAIGVLKSAIRSESSGILPALLGSVYLSLGRTNDAIQANLLSIERSPSLLIGYHNLANLYSRQNQPEEGLKVLEKATQVAKPSAQFLVELAELWLGFPQTKPDLVTHSRKRAGELLDRALKMPSVPPPLQQRAADAYMLIGQNPKAIELYLKLLEVYPQATPIRERLADLFLQSRDSKRAIEQMQAMIKEEPSRYPQAYVILGSLALQEGKFRDAEDYFRKAVVLTPQVEAVYYDLAVSQINAGNVRQGLETLDDARRRFKESFQSEFFAGIGHARLKEYPEAVKRLGSAEIIATASETNRLTHLFYFQLGSAHERNKNLEEAERYFKKALVKMPDFGEALNYMGYMWVEAGVRLDEARKLIEKAVQLEPKNAAFLDSMAWVLFRQGKAKEALGWMKKCLEASTEPDATLQDHLADIQAALGNVEAARAAYKKSLEIEDNPEVKKKLENFKPAGSPP